jgi:uncharacterized protein
LDPAIVIFGLGVGLLVGMTGIGGGSIMTPLLILVVGTPPVTAVGSDLAYGAITKTVGGWRHWRQGTVDLGVALWLGAGSVPGAVGGVFVLEELEEAYGNSIEQILLGAVAGVLLLTALAMLTRALLLPDMSEHERDTVIFTRREKVGAVLIGVSVGFVLGATSAGSGALIAVGLILFFRLRPRRVVGTDVFHAAILLWVAGALHLVNGNVDLGLVGNILVGSLPGVWFGSRLAAGVREDVLRPVLGVVLFAAGLALTSKAGAAIPAPLFGLLVVLLSLGVAYAFRRRARASAQPPGQDPDASLDSARSPAA